MVREAGSVKRIRVVRHKKGTTKGCLKKRQGGGVRRLLAQVPLQTHVCPIG